MSSNVIEATEQPAPVEQELEASADQAATQEDTTQDGDDADSALGADDASSTTSANSNSSIYEYRSLHGRTYHAQIGRLSNVEYWGCNDEKQKEALDILHHASLLETEGRLYHAPLREDLEKVIDIGTGTGIWAIDFADEFPEATIVGTDISPIQPKWVPPNLKFEIEDCTKNWTFKPDSIDYVHVHWMNGSIESWTNFFKQAYRCLKPGGYIESWEPSVVIESDDESVTKDSMMVRWGDIFLEAGKKLGRTFTVLEEDLQKKEMEKAGLMNIQVKDLKTPVGIWPKEPKKRDIGRYTGVALHDVEGFVLHSADKIGWSKEEIQVFAAKFRKELKNPKIHAYYRQKIVWGQKEF